MISYSDQGIIIRRFPYGEGDIMLVVFSQYHGKVSLIAKSVKKIKSRRSGHVDLFNRIEFSCRGDSGIPYLSEVNALETNERIKTNLSRMKYAYQIAELIDVLLVDEGEYPVIYKSSVDYFKLLNRQNPLTKTDVDYKHEKYLIEFLSELGYWDDGHVNTEMFNQMPDKLGYLKTLVESIAEKNLKSTDVFK